HAQCKAVQVPRASLHIILRQVELGCQTLRGARSHSDAYAPAVGGRGACADMPSGQHGGQCVNRPMRKSDVQPMRRQIKTDPERHDRVLARFGGTGSDTKPNEWAVHRPALCVSGCEYPRLEGWAAQAGAKVLRWRVRPQKEVAS